MIWGNRTMWFKCLQLKNTGWLTYRTQETKLKPLSSNKLQAMLKNYLVKTI